MVVNNKSSGPVMAATATPGLISWGTRFSASSRSRLMFSNVRFNGTYTKVCLLNGIALNIKSVLLRISDKSKNQQEISTLFDFMGLEI